VESGSISTISGKSTSDTEENEVEVDEVVVPSGEVVVLVDDFPVPTWEVTDVVVSDETAGGSPQPTTVTANIRDTTRLTKIILGMSHRHLNSKPETPEHWSDSKPPISTILSGKRTFREVRGNGTSGAVVPAATVPRSRKDAPI
jgi:hypothetical protein